MDSMLSLLGLSNHIYVNGCISGGSAVTWVYKYKLLSPAALSFFRFLVYKVVNFYERLTGLPIFFRPDYFPIICQLTPLHKLYSYKRP